MQTIFAALAIVTTVVQGPVKPPRQRVPATIVVPPVTPALLQAQLAALEAIEPATAALAAAGPELDAALAQLEGDEQDPADSLYRAGRRALNRGRYQEAVDLLREVVRRYPQSMYADDALYYTAYALYRTGDTRTLQQALEVLAQLRAKYPDASMRGDAATLAARINGELARRGDADAAARVQQQAESASAQPRGQAGRCTMEDDDDDPRIAALNALLQMDAANAVPILKQVLAKRDQCSVQLRRKAVFILSQKRSPETTAILLDAARSDPDQEVREQAVFWLSQVRGDEAVAALDSILQKSTDRPIQEKAIFALSQQRSPRAGAALRAFVERRDAPEDLREKAIFWLGQNNSPENAEFLQNLFPRLESQDLKEKVLFSISQMRGATSGQWLMDVALNEREDLEIRKKALFWAGQRHSASIDDLVKLYARMPDREIREQLIFVYSQRRDSAAVDKLMDIAKNDADRELRKKAIFWLGQSRDPRVVQFLLELINQ
jgi:HEAT repeat protein